MRKAFQFTIIFILAGLIHSCSGNKSGQKEVNIINPVLAGDRPDPCILKIGDTYWASATSNEWAPLFPIFKSDDMIHWELVSYVFPEGAPEWALKNFWAPELTYDPEQKKVYLYYTARAKETGRLTVAVASADRPDGIYTDHGPLVSQEPGSIDAFEIKDKDKIYVSWKEDGNSMGRPTPMWIQEINKERTQLTGEPLEIFRNDESDDSGWERWLVEGICIFKRGDYFYATYSGGSCCDIHCNYKTGVARSKNILGPWEKYPDNPILTDNDAWKCPGHGTVTTFGEDYYMLYHAYSTTGDVYVGRQGILEKLYWTDDDWPYLKNDAKYNRETESLNFRDNFSASSLNPLWQWGVKQKIQFATGEKGLELYASSQNENIGTLLVQQTKSLDYTLSAEIDTELSGNNVFSGIAIVGASDNGFGAPVAAIGISVNKEKGIEVWKTTHGKKEILDTKEIKSTTIILKMDVMKGHLLRFAYQLPDGAEQTMASGLDASGLIPWGMGFRYGIVAEGSGNEYALFKEVNLSNQ